MARLPIPGSDSNEWGTILNEFLGVQHNSDGTHASSIEQTAHKGQPNGYAPLNGSSQLDIGYLSTIPQSKIENLSTDLSDKVAIDAQVVNVVDHGVVGDAVRLRDVAANTGSSTVTASNGAFVSGDVGKTVLVYTENSAGTIRTIASVQSATQITLSGAAGITVSGTTGYLVYGTDNAAAINAALIAAAPSDVDTTVGPNQPMGTGLVRVLFPAQTNDTGYMIGAQISVPSGIMIDAPGMIFNVLADRYEPSLLFNPYSAAVNLIIECLFGAGIQAGTGGADQAHIYIDNLRLWHIGEGTEISGALRSQNGIELKGYHFEIRNLFTKGGVRSVYHNPGTDTVVSYAYAIGSHTAVHIDAGNQIAYPRLFLDTCGQDGGGTNGIIIDNQASNIAMNIQAFEVTGTLHVLDSVVAVGAINTGVNKDIHLTIQANNTGGTVLLMSYAQELVADILGSNAPIASGAIHPITSGVIYGLGNTGINHIEAMLETSITPYMGTAQGTYHYSQLDQEHFITPITVGGVVTATNTPSTDIYNGNAITNGEEIMQRHDVIGANQLNASGTLHLSYFTARKTETAANIRMLSDATVATGVTLARMGVYSVDELGDLTLVASTANDATLFDSAYTPYQRAFTTSFTKTKGQRYAVGVLVVGDVMPSVTGITCAGADAALDPRICGIVTGQTDLPATLAAGAIAEDYRIYQTTITP
jgi:hypothetical protein